MEVNDELAVLRRALPAAVDAIRVGGRVVVESYHSLEDRLVKQTFAAATRSDVPLDLPFVPEGHEPALRLVTRGAEQAGADEIDQNPRAASVRLRADRSESEESRHEQSGRPAAHPGAADRRGRGREGPAAGGARVAVPGRPGCRSWRWSAWCCSAA